MAGARDGDVGEPQPLRERLARGERGGPLLPGPPEAEARTVRRLRIVEEDGPHAAAVVAPTRRQRGRDDDGVLEPLAAMHGDDAHRLGVALEPQLRRVDDALVARTPVVADALEPPLERRRSQVARGRRLVQELPEVQDVGGAPLAARLAQQARHDVELVEERAVGVAEAPRAPPLVPPLEALDPRLPGRLVGGEAKELLAVHADQPRGQRGADAVAPRRGGERAEDQGHLERLLRVEDAPVPVEHRGHAEPRELPLHPLGLVVGAREHGDVGRPERGAVEGRARAEPAHDLRGGRGGHVTRRAAARPRRGPQLRRAQDHELHRAVLATRGRQALRRARARRHRPIADVLEQERRGDAREQAVHRRHQPRIGAVADVEGERLPPHVARGAQVGEQIRAPERVDGLLGVPDDEERRRRIRVDPVQDLVLHRVRVLELVDQRRGVARAEGGREPLPTGAAQGAEELEEQIIEGDDARAPPGGGQRGARMRDEALLEGEHPRLERLTGAVMGADQRLEELEAGVMRRRVARPGRLREGPGR